MSVPPTSGNDPWGSTPPTGGQPGYPQQGPNYPQQPDLSKQPPGYQQPPGYGQQQPYPQQGAPGGYHPPNAFSPGGYPQQPGYGQMPPPPPGGFGPNPSVRPGMVTAAAVLAFVVGGLTLIAALLVFGISTSVLISGYGFLKFLAFVQIVVGAALIWGGVQAINGKDARILTITAGVGILLQIISMFIYFQTTSLLGFVIPILIIVFLMNPRSKAWLDLKGAKHF